VTDNCDAFSLPKTPFCKNYFGCLLLILFMSAVKPKSKLIPLTHHYGNRQSDNQSNLEANVADEKRGETCVVVLCTSDWMKEWRKLLSQSFSVKEKYQSLMTPNGKSL